MINIFFDTEFTELEEERARLISIGFVDESGGNRFYAELTDTWQMSHCSKFVISNVLPLLEGGTSQMTISDLRGSLKAWIEALGDEARLISDEPSWDWPLISRIFPDADTWPQNLAKKPADLGLDKTQWTQYKDAVKRQFTFGLRQHHAGDDAEAMRQGWISATRDR